MCLSYWNEHVLSCLCYVHQTNVAEIAPLIYTRVPGRSCPGDYTTHLTLTHLGVNATRATRQSATRSHLFYQSLIFFRHEWTTEKDNVSIISKSHVFMNNINLLQLKSIILSYFCCRTRQENIAIAQKYCSTQTDQQHSI